MLRYIEVKNELRSMLKFLNPGEKLPSRTELCKRFDTTRTTLDKAIKELTIQGQLISQKGSGTYVSSNLDTMKPKDENWCVIVPDISEAVYATLVQGIESVAQTSNANIILCSSNGKFSLQQRFIQRLMIKNTVGFIIVPVIGSSAQENLDLYNTLIRSKVPFIFCNRYVDGIRAPIVTSNDFYGGYIATKYLIQKGYKRVAFISEHKYEVSMNRCQGYLTALLEAGIEIDRHLIVMPPNLNISIDPYEKSLELLSEKKPDAFFCFNDLVAFKIMKSVQDFGLSVSDDVGIIGYDDNEVDKSLFPPLTSVSHKTLDIGKKAAEIMQKLIRGEKMSSEFDYYLFQPEIMERDSCKGPRMVSVL